MASINYEAVAMIRLPDIDFRVRQPSEFAESAWKLTE